jgi:hypothetical protein
LPQNLQKKKIGYKKGSDGQNSKQRHEDHIIFLSSSQYFSPMRQRKAFDFSAYRAHWIAHILPSTKVFPILSGLIKQRDYFLFPPSEKIPNHSFVEGHIFFIFLGAAVTSADRWPSAPKMSGHPIGKWKRGGKQIEDKENNGFLRPVISQGEI